MSTQINFIRSFLEIDEQFYRGISKQKYDDKGCEIELDNVTFGCIENMNLKINKGEKIALVGSNGAGKTTLITKILNQTALNYLAVRLKKWQWHEHYTKMPHLLS